MIFMSLVYQGTIPSLIYHYETDGPKEIQMASCSNDYLPNYHGELTMYLLNCLISLGCLINV
jgi:hypothetical protein